MFASRSAVPEIGTESVFHRNNAAVKSQSGVRGRELGRCGPFNRHLRITLTIPRMNAFLFSRRENNVNGTPSGRRRVNSFLRSRLDSHELGPLTTNSNVSSSTPSEKRVSFANEICSEHTCFHVYPSLFISGAAWFLHESIGSTACLELRYIRLVP